MFVSLVACCVLCVFARVGCGGGGAVECRRVDAHRRVLALATYSARAQRPCYCVCIKLEICLGYANVVCLLVVFDVVYMHTCI